MKKAEHSLTLPDSAHTTGDKLIKDIKMEKVILELLEKLKNINHSESMDDTSDIETCWEWQLYREEIQQQLNHILA